MVFLTMLNFGRRKNRLFANPFTTPILESPDKAWGRRKVKMCTAHLGFRPRNCFKLARVKMLKYLQYETRDRGPNQRDIGDLQRLRIEGAATEYNYDSWNMREALTRNVFEL